MSTSKQPFAFISYRRSDAAQAIQGLFFQLRIRLGPSRIFMDVGAISVGDLWPDRLRRALGEATVVVAVMGPSWLTVADRYGRRRLDQADDWVRAEITSALSVGTPILPVLVGGASEMPQAEGLPSDLCGILQHQCLRLRDERWDDDMNQLVETLVKKHGFVEADSSVVLPQPEVRLKPLTEEELVYRFS